MVTVCEQEREEIAVLFGQFQRSAFSGREMTVILNISTREGISKTRRWEYRGIIERAEKPSRPAGTVRVRNWWRVTQWMIENMRETGHIEATA